MNAEINTIQGQELPRLYHRGYRRYGAALLLSSGAMLAGIPLAVTGNIEAAGVVSGAGVVGFGATAVRVEMKDRARQQSQTGERIIVEPGRLRMKLSFRRNRQS